MKRGPELISRNPTCLRKTFLLLPSKHRDLPPASHVNGPEELPPALVVRVPHVGILHGSLEEPLEANVLPEGVAYQQNKKSLELADTLRLGEGLGKAKKKNEPGVEVLLGTSNKNSCCQASTRKGSAQKACPTKSCWLLAGRSGGCQAPKPRQSRDLVKVMVKPAPIAGKGTCDFSRSNISTQFSRIHPELERTQVPKNIFGTTRRPLLGFKCPMLSTTQMLCVVA